MKITHVALVGIVTDYWTYQDNLLPKYHKKNGYDVSIITSHLVKSILVCKFLGNDFVMGHPA